MASSDLYKDAMKEHYRHPRNYGHLDNADVVRRGSNPRCGDEVEVGVFSMATPSHRFVSAGVAVRYAWPARHW